MCVGQPVIIPVCLSTHFGVMDQQIAGVPRVRRTLIFSENSSDMGIEKRFPSGQRRELTTPR